MEEMDLRETGCNGVNWIQMFQDMMGFCDQVMNFKVLLEVISSAKSNNCHLIKEDHDLWSEI
jgi:hypothetical protein